MIYLTLVVIVLSWYIFSENEIIMCQKIRPIVNKLQKHNLEKQVLFTISRVRVCTHS